MLSAIPFRYASGAGFVKSLRPVAWYRYGQGITSANSLVSAWADASGNGNDLEQATGANQPTLDSDNSILFDGVDNYLQALFTMDQPFAVYAVAKQITWASNATLIGGGTLGANFLQAGSSPAMALNAGSLLGIVGEALDTWQVMGYVLNGASSVTRINLDTETTGDAGATNAGGITLGARAAATSFAHCAFREVIAIAGATEIDPRVIRYLAQVGSVAL